MSKKKLPSYVRPLKQETPDYVRQLDTTDVKEPDMGPSALGEFGQVAAEAIDVPASFARAGAYGAIAEDTSIGEELGKQFERIKPTTPEKMTEGPRGYDILEASGVENETVKKYGGMAVEAVMDPLQAIPVGKMLAPIRRTIKSKVAAGPVSRTLSEFISTGQYTGERIRPEILAKKVVTEDLLKYSTRPKKMLEAIEGSAPLSITGELPSGKVALDYGRKKGGLLNEISDELWGHIKDVSKKAPKVTSVRVGREPILLKLGEMTQKTSGRGYDPKQYEAYEKAINSILEKENLFEKSATSWEKLPSKARVGGKILNLKGKKAKPKYVKTEFSLKELFELKKDIGLQLGSKEFFKDPSESMAIKKEAMVDLTKTIDSIIKERLTPFDISLDGKTINAADYYKIQNNRLHHMLQLRSILNTSELTELRDITFSQLLAEAGLVGATATGMGAVTGSPLASGLTAATGSALWTARAKGRGMADPILSRLTDIGVDVATTPRGIPQASRELREEPPSVETPYAQRMMREPQGSPEPDLTNTRLSKSPDDVVSKPLSTKLIKMKMSRNTESYKDPQVRQHFKYKFAQLAEEFVRDEMAAFGEMRPDPMIVANAAHKKYQKIELLMDEYTDEIGAMLPYLIKKYPMMFEKDRLDRVDGVVPESNKAMAREEITTMLKQNQLGPVKKQTNSELVQKMIELTLTGRYEDI